MLYIISAPSGGGKTSLVRALTAKVDNLVISVSHTTRPPRTEEIEGINYHFVSPAQFRQLILDEKFLEYAQVFSHLYGTAKDSVNEKIAAGKDVILEIDWQGAQQIRTIFQQRISIFILPPSLEVLHKRLKARAQDKNFVIEKRMQTAKSECSHVFEFDYCIINDNFNQAVSELEMIIQTQRLKTHLQLKKYQRLINEIIFI